jgi:hypothetical protein
MVNTLLRKLSAIIEEPKNFNRQADNIHDGKLSFN